MKIEWDTWIALCWFVISAVGLTFMWFEQWQIACTVFCFGIFVASLLALMRNLSTRP